MQDTCEGRSGATNQIAREKVVSLGSQSSIRSCHFTDVAYVLVQKKNDPRYVIHTGCNIIICHNILDDGKDRQPRTS